MDRTIHEVKREIEKLRAELEAIPADARRIYLQIADRIRETESRLHREMKYASFLEGKK